MSSLFDSSSKSPTAYQLTGGGTGAPWNWGVSSFDQSAIDQATTSNAQAIQDRYNQLGLGSSTMAGQDVGQTNLMGQAMTGQLQTQDVANPALNPALQPELNQIIGNLSSGSSGSSSSSSSLSNLAQSLGFNQGSSTSGSTTSGSSQSTG